MLRLLFILITAIPSAFIFISRAIIVTFLPNKYTEEERYDFVRHYCKVLQKKGHIQTSAYGTEYLPKSGGYVLFPNHQGKYDAVGIIASHESPCSIMMEKTRSRLVFANECIVLLNGVRLDRKSMRAQVKSIQKVISDVKAGRRFIVFPEGGYRHNRNEVKEFLPGAFKCAIKAKAPIVPVALIDSYIPFEYNSLKPVHTQLHFLPPLYYEEYKDMTSQEIAELVRAKIIGKIITAE